jgi:hypothetical protein
LPVNPLIVIGLWAGVCVGAFVVGLHFYRMAEAPGESVSVEQARRFGRLLMMASTAMLLFLGAAWVHGDLKVPT